MFYSKENIQVFLKKKTLHTLYATLSGIGIVLEKLI
jgi:hypothetical protein